MKMKDTFCNFFLNSYFSKIMWIRKYFFENVICGKCKNKGRKDISRLKLSIDVVTNAEPYEVDLENMGYKRSERNMRLLFSIVSFVILVVVELCIRISLNAIQRWVTKNKNMFGNI